MIVRVSISKGSNLASSIAVAPFEIHRGNESLDVNEEVPSAEIETIDHLEEASISAPSDGDQRPERGRFGFR